MFPLQRAGARSLLGEIRSRMPQGYGFSSSHVRMWELDYKESWAWKNWSFWTAVLEKTLESPLDCKEIQPVQPKGDQSWMFIGRTDVEAETPILWPPDAKSWLMWKDPDAGKDWGQEEKGMTEGEMVGWHHRLNGYGFGGDSGSWWWTGRPGMLQFMGSQRVGHDWATELNWSSQPQVWLALLSISEPTHSPQKQILMVTHMSLWKRTMKATERKVVNMSYDKHMLWCIASAFQ